MVGVSHPHTLNNQTTYVDFRARVEGTTIDERTLLSTDYFNSFNEIVMLISMVPDAPEVLEDIRGWQFRTYEEHFQNSMLSFGPLAIEAYAHSPSDVRQRFEELIAELRRVIDEAQLKLSVGESEDAQFRLKIDAQHFSLHLQNLIEAGSGIVHGADMKIDQSEVDKLF